MMTLNKYIKGLLVNSLFLLISLVGYSQVVLTIEGQTYTSTVNIPRTVPTLLTFKNNDVEIYQASGIMIWAGDDEPQPTNRNLDNAVITGNRIEFTGPFGSSIITHGLMSGYNINYDIRYNYFLNTIYAIVNESDNEMEWTSGGVAYNILRSDVSTNRYGLVNTYDNCPIYNNTFYNSPLRLHPTDALDPYDTVYNVKVKNNIFYQSTGRGNQVIEIWTNVYNGVDNNGFECDYNLYYVEDDDHYPNFLTYDPWEDDWDILTWTQWRALGFDTHSVVVDPDFINTTDFVPSSRLDYGTNLGATWDDGLSVDAVWSTDDPATTVQNGTWQVGARIYEGPPSSTAYYISPTGDDGDAGTYASPWATIQHAIATVVAGDTVYIREGTYNITSSGGISFATGNDGTAGNPICYFNYPGEEPVFDGTSQSSSNFPRGFSVTDVSYLYFKGITISNIWNATNTANAVYMNDNSMHITFENFRVQRIRGIGYQVGGDGNVFINCDAYHCVDVALGGGDGWQVNSDEHRYTTTFRGCRAMHTSDDGWDNFWNDGYVYYDSCWVINSGIDPTTGVWYGDGAAGNGFKLDGYNGTRLLGPTGTTQRRLTNCVAVNNIGAGFTENNASYPQMQMELYNNIAYDNDWAGFVNYNTSSITYRATYRNNIAYANNPNTQWYSPSKLIHDHNSWNTGAPTITNVDFVSLDTIGATADRQSDGSLPNNSFYNNFLHLAETSDLINAGVDVDIEFVGSAPDLGPFEFDGFEVEPSVPYISTTEPYGITIQTAYSGGYMISDGGSPITAKGICYSINQFPSTLDNTVSGGSGDADFNVQMSGLLPITTYHVRAYATNAVGTVYGADEDFTTSQSSIIKHGGKIVKR
jgi:hypothetical protein